MDNNENNFNLPKHPDQEDHHLREKIRKFMLVQTEWKSPLEITAAVGEDRSRRETVMKRMRELFTPDYGNYFKHIKWIRENGKLIIHYKMGMPLFKEGDLFAGYRQEQEDHNVEELHPSIGRPDL